MGHDSGEVHDYLVSRIQARADAATLPIVTLATAVAIALTMYLFGGTLPTQMASGFAFCDLLPSQVGSFGLLYGALAATMLLSRVSRRLREPVSLALGGGLHAWVLGWRLALIWAAVVVAVHVTPRVGSYVRMAFVIVALFVATRYVLPVAVSFASPAPFAGLIICGNSAMRVVVFAFERPAIHSRERSILRTLSYSFGLLMVLAPTCIAYSTVFSDKSDSALRKMATNDLFWFSVKIVVLTLFLRALYALMPAPEAFFSAPALVKLITLPSNYVIAVFLATYASNDFGAAMGCLAGYNMPAANDFPLLSATPMQFWRRLNVHVVDFYRRAVIFEVARRFGRSMPVIVVAAMSANAIHHVFFLGMSVFAVLPIVQAVYLALPIVLLVDLFVSIYADKVFDRLGNVGRLVMAIGFLLARSVKLFFLYEFTYDVLKPYSGLVARGHDIETWRCALVLGSGNAQCATSAHFFTAIPSGIALAVLFLLLVASLAGAQGVLIRSRALRSSSNVG